MLSLGYVLLYVDDVARSAAFYGALLARNPVEQSPTFALFVFDGGARLGLWSRHTVTPAPDGRPGATEIALPSDDVDAVHAAWVARGIVILQPPEPADFGRSFLALDPDRHRIRVLTVTE